MMMNNLSLMNEVSAAVNFAPASPAEEKYEAALYNAAHADHLRVIPARLHSPLEKKYNFILKQVFDTLLSSLLIVLVLSWLLPLIAIIIKLDSRGPVFFLQKRNKRKGKVFTCIKFRTMIVNTDADVVAACEDDERITRVGRFLRRHHLDEFPQLFNVLMGDMSLIGPRPHMIAENQKYEVLVRGYSNRHNIKPGITGLAQSLGHFGFTSNVQEMNERVALDVQYIRRWSAKMDLQIIWRTFLTMFP